jgi:hypothetical protein
VGPRKIIFNGTPGEVWRNDTARVQYQFVCALINTCGFCLQYHMAIGSIWGIPMHWGCRCEQKRISIGANAPNAFVDFREVLDNMSHSDQVAAIGSSNYRLLKMGVADWKDIVTPNRVRDFREVVANKRLNVKTLVGAGVNPKVAERAYATVNTPGHVLAEQHQMALAKHALDAGLHLNELTEQLGKKIAGRVSIAAGPDSYGTGPAWSGGPVAPPSWSGPGHATELAALLATAAARRNPPKPSPPSSAIDSSEDFAPIPKAEYKDWYFKHYDQWAWKLDKEQDASLEEYISKQYEVINSALRNSGEALPEDIARTVKNIDAALRSAPRVSQDLVAYRNTTLESVLKANGITRDQLKPGVVLHDSAYTSTSILQREASHFGPQAFEVRVRKGFAAAVISRGEAELLLPRGTALKVIEIKDDRIIVEAIAQTA